MSRWAVYNEIDEHAAAWLENLIAAGHVAPGVVDRRSITEVGEYDYREFRQVHLFAGIGGWSLALRLAGWSDDRPVWTGSCPCQPFSAAGKGQAFEDERHLWPQMARLVAAARPAAVMGEQVDAAVRWGWLDLVFADLERGGYACRAADIPAAGIGAPHIRQRLWWRAERVADSGGEGLPQRRGDGRVQRETLGAFAGEAAIGSGDAGRLADDHGTRRDARRRDDPIARHGASVAADCELGGMGHADRERPGRDARAGVEAQGGAPLRAVGDVPIASGATSRPGPTNGFWRDADWLGCRDAKWRPVRPGSFPLADGVPGRVGRLRAYGNAIVPQVAAAFIRATEEADRPVLLTDPFA